MTLPKGYQAASSKQAAGDSASLPPAACRPPEYQRSRAPKHNETNRRPARPAGPVKVCKCCYRKGHDIFEHVCPRCLADRFELAKLEQEIAKIFPSTGRLTNAKIFAGIWKSYQRQRDQIRKLKAQVAGLKEDVKELTK